MATRNHRNSKEFAQENVPDEGHNSIIGEESNFLRRSLARRNGNQIKVSAENADIDEITRKDPVRAFFWEFNP